MAYTPDATDASQPTADKFVESAAAEFRALKARVNNLVLSGGGNSGPIVRQTALSGAKDSNGNPSFLSAGTGLALNLLASTSPLVLTYAAGSGATGDFNFGEALSADVNSVVAGLAPNNLNYIAKLFGDVWSSTLAPPQYGKFFNRSAQLLVRWPGANNATATTEDFGNTLTFAGNAKLSTGTQILGLNTVALDGTGDYVSTPFTDFGASSWEIFGSFRTASVAAQQRIVSVVNTGGFGVDLRINTTPRMVLSVSSNGTSFDIVASVVGTAVIAINTTYYYRVVFDAVGGTYTLYLSNNGAAETVDVTTASTVRVCYTSFFIIGANISGAEAFNGNIGFTGFRRYASFTSAQAAGPSVAPTFASVATDYFDIQLMKMFQITAASAAAGTDPTMVAINKIYLGRANTSGVAVTSVVNYAYRGQFESLPSTPLVAVATIAQANHNIGVVPRIFSMKLRCLTADRSFVKGDELVPFGVGGTYSYPLTPSVTNELIEVRSATTAAFGVTNKLTGADASATASSWALLFYAERGW